MPPAKPSQQNDIDKWLSGDTVRESMSLYTRCFFQIKTKWCVIKYDMIFSLCVLLCSEMQEDQSSVSEGVTSEGVFFSLLVPFCHCVKIMFHNSCLLCVHVSTHASNYNCPFQTLTSFWRIGRRQQTTAARQFAACPPPHPDSRPNLPGNRTDRMTSFFHFEFADKQEKWVNVHKDQYTHSVTLKYIYNLSHAVQSQVFSESAHTHTHNKTGHYRTAA